MLDAYSACFLFMEDYTDRVRYGEEDADEALQNAVDFTLRKFSDEVRAETTLRVAEAWRTCPPEARFVQAERIFREVLNG